MTRYKLKNLLIIIFFLSCFISTSYSFNQFLSANEIVITKKVKQNYEFGFDTTLYDHYFQQLSEQGEQLDNLPVELKKILTAPGTSPTEKRATHEMIITLMRDWLEKEEVDPSILADIDTLSFYMLTNVDNFLEHEKSLHAYLDLSDAAIASKPLPELIQDHYATLSEIFSGTGHFSKIPEKSDYFFEGFLPSKLFTIDSSQYLYLFNPLIVEKWSKKAKVDPIFLSYLRQLKKMNKKHLYINVKSRMNALEQLTNSDEFKEVFILCTLDKSSDFYRQKNAWENQSDVKKLTKALKRNLFTSPDRSQWPDDLLNTDWEEKISAMIDHVHTTYFNNAPTLDTAQRGAFIEITYAIITKELRTLYQPDYINATCVFTNDRGPSQYALEYAFDRIEKNHQMTAEESRHLLTLFFIPPILNHYRTSHDPRVQRLSATIDTLLQQQTHN